VHPSVLGLVGRAKGVEHTALVTDAIVTPDNGSADLGGRRVELHDGAPYLADGTLAGSALTMNEAVRRMHERAGLPLIDCIRMATETPARVLGLEDEFGVLKAGAKADVVICDDHISISTVIIGGQTVYDAA
jgi:N-acetylglucosamine-6-phosphate deacetylase